MFLGLPFVIQKNLFDNNPELQKNLKTIYEITASPVYFEVDYLDVYNRVKDTQREAQERLGDILIQGYLKHIAELYDLSNDNYNSF
jgi:hypothetical protein